MIDSTSYVKSYLEGVLRLPLGISLLDQNDIGLLAIWIRRSFRFYSVRLDKWEFLLLEPIGDGPLSPGRMRAVMNAVHQSSGLMAAIVVPQLESWIVQRYIREGIPFIVPGKQLYLPMLGLRLSQVRAAVTGVRFRFRPATQAILFAHLYKENLNGLQQKEIAGKLGYSEITISRAMTEFRQAKLIPVNKGEVRFMEDRELLWATATPFLINPLGALRFADAVLPASGLLVSGYSALGHYTDLVSNEQPAYALYVRDWPLVMRKYLKDPNENGGQVKVECWKYPPHLVSDSEFVDPFSLYMSMEGISDGERITQALDHLLRQYL